MMINRESEFEEQLKSAYRHIVKELGVENVRPSFRMEFENLQKAHDAIHEFTHLAHLLVPSQENGEISLHRKSAFLIIYGWEAFHHAHRSLIEALCAYYNVAFVLLRVTLELLIKGAFWECLSHREFRKNSQVLNEDKDRSGQDSPGRELKKWLNAIFEIAPHVEEELEETSAGIYDKIEDLKFRLHIKTIFRQLDQWGIFTPISNPMASIYCGLYGRLSADVHVRPDRTDIGKRLLLGEEIFEQKVLPNILTEYTNCLHEVMDLAIVVELNIMRDLVEKYDEAKTNLRGRLDVLEQLGLGHSLIRAKELLK